MCPAPGVQVHEEHASSCLDAGTPRHATPDLGAYELAAVSHIYLPLALKSAGS
jgi:hypothetical protein